MSPTSIPSADLRTARWSSMHVITALLHRQGRPVALGMVILLSVLYTWLGEVYWSPVRHAVFDTYQRFFPRQVQGLPVTIVDIDDASLAALGQWPWSRTSLARLINATRHLGALVVGLDMIMPEADRLSPQMFIADRPDISATLREALARLPSNDVILADTLRQVPSVVGRAGTAAKAGEKVSADWQTQVRVYGEMPESHVQDYANHVTNLSIIEDAASGRGYLNATPDADGVVRAMPLLIKVHGKLAPTFALELLRVAVGTPWYSVHSGPHGIRGVQVGTSFIPTDTDGRIHLHYASPDPRRRVSALAILNGGAEAQALQHKVAIIGVTAVALTDIVATPVTTRMDGVEIHAQLIENILAGTRLVRPWVARWVEVGVFLAIAAALIGFLPHTRPGLGIVMFLVGAVAITLGSLAVFRYTKWMFDPSFPIAGHAVIVVVLLTAGFAAADRRKRELQRILEEKQAEMLRVAGELKAARDIQMGMVPTPGTITGLPDTIEFHAFLEPATEVGGDLYDAFMLDTHHLFFLIGDVAGKGIPAALFMALSKTLCKNAALRQRVPLHELVILVNAEISRENPATLFVAMVMGILDARTGELAWCRAGQQAPIILRQGEAPWVLDTAGGPPLCVLDDFPYASDHMQLHPGDTLVMVTDGVTEAQNLQHDFYGLERLLAALTSVPQNAKGHHSAIATCQRLYDDLKNFTNGAPPSDDITIVTIRFAGPTPSTP